MFWEDHGGTGPCLLMVHGILSGLAQWTDNLPALRRHCRPITVELWGHGRSPSPTAPECYAPSHWVEQFEAIRQALGVKQWFLLGTSLGAGATIRYALTYPDRVVGHIFTNSASGFAEPAKIAANAEKAVATANKILQGGHKALEQIPVHPRHARRLPDHLRQALLRDAAALDPVGIANIIRYSNPHLSVRDAIGSNRTPALLICGSRERRFLPHRDYAAENMPHLAIADLAAGHGVNMEVPDQFNQLTCEFVARAQVSPPNR